MNNTMMNIAPFIGDTIFVARCHWEQFEGKIDEIIEKKYLGSDGEPVPFIYECVGHRVYNNPIKENLFEFKHVRLGIKKETREWVYDEEEGTGMIASHGRCLAEIAFNDNVVITRRIEGVTCKFKLVGKENREGDNAVILNLERVNIDGGPIIKNSTLEEEVEKLRERVAIVEEENKEIRKKATKRKREMEYEQSQKKIEDEEETIIDKKGHSEKHQSLFGKIFRKK